jgi:hypothetical protein
VRLTSRRPESALEQRRERMRRDRAATKTLRVAFPAVERVRVDLRFENTTSPVPAPQSHVLHPPARAFFQFPCPYADCHGQFDLNSVAELVMTKSKGHVEGLLECSGVRSRERMLKQPCGLRLTYTVAAQYQTKADA